MANLYGVANPTPLASIYQTIGAADVVCTAGAETNIVACGPLAAISTGFFYPVLFCTTAISCGATPPGAITIAARVGAGADWTQVNVSPTILIANANFSLCNVLAGPNSDPTWRPPGSTMNISINPTGQNVTCRFIGTWVFAILFRGPDT